jgi:hypothetical protein
VGVKTAQKGLKKNRVVSFNDVTIHENISFQFLMYKYFAIENRRLQTKGLRPLVQMSNFYL